MAGLHAAVALRWVPVLLACALAFAVWSILIMVVALGERPRSRTASA